MLFPTLSFGLFFLVVYAVAWAFSLSNEWRKIALLLASWFFYGAWDGRWFDELTPGPATEPLRVPVERWSAATARLDAPRASMRAVWERLKAARFGAEQPGQQGAGDAR